MRKVGELARFKQEASRYNSNHGTRLSWGEGLNSARLEQAPSRYNSNYSTRLMGGVEWEPPRYNSKLGYNSSFLRFGVCGSG